MNPKDGKAPSAVSPAEPDDAYDADVADPGEVEKTKAEQVAKQEGKYGSTPVKPHKAPQTAEERKEKTSWIEIELLDETDNPVPGEKYEITLPDNSVASGTLDSKGFARVEGIVPGTCKVTFPDLDQSTWKKA